MQFSFNMEDASQVFVGAFALAVPISFTEEAWRLGETLALSNILMLLSLSLIFLSLFSYQSVFQRNIKHRFPVFVIRIIIDYSMAAMVVALVLLCIDKLPLLSEPLVAIKRIVIIAMPASMGAIVVDSFDKE